MVWQEKREPMEVSGSRSLQQQWNAFWKRDMTGHPGQYELLGKGLVLLYQWLHRHNKMAEVDDRYWKEQGYTERRLFSK